MHLQLESNLGVQLRPAANADLEMQVSGNLPNSAARLHVL